MAKAKTTQASGSAPSAKASTSKKSSKKTAPPAKTAAAPSVPSIDTSLAANAAAKMVAAKLSSPIATPDSKESAAFKALKQSVSNPAPGGLDNVLGTGGGTIGHKSHTPFGGPKQMGGRNQRFGADVNRAGVPRRTGGG